MCGLACGDCDLEAAKLCNELKTDRKGSQDNTLMKALAYYCSCWSLRVGILEWPTGRAFPLLPCLPVSVAFGELFTVGGSSSECSSALWVGCGRGSLSSWVDNTGFPDLFTRYSLMWCIVIGVWLILRGFSRGFSFSSRVTSTSVGLGLLWMLVTGTLAGLSEMIVSICRFCSWAEPVSSTPAHVTIQWYVLLQL